MSQNKNPLKIGLIYGTMLGIVVVSIGIIRYKTGMILRDDQMLSYVYWGIFTMVIFSAVFQFKKQNPLSFSYNRTITIGLFAGLISGLMYTIYIVILNSYIDTELASKIIHFKEQTNILKNSEISAKDITDSTKIMQMSSALRGLIYTLVCMTFGVIHSLVSTFVAKRLNYKSQ
nr:DUF4199 family protein [uncultured Flavobacterium sp.]